MQPKVHNRIIFTRNKVVILPGFNDDDVSRLARVSLAVHLHDAFALEDDESLAIIVHMPSFRMRPEPGLLPTEPAEIQILAGKDSPFMVASNSSGE